MTERIDAARFAAFLAAGVALVAAMPDVSDVGTDRYYEMHRVLPAFEYPVLGRTLFLAERAISGSRTGISLVNAVIGVVIAVVVLVLLVRSDRVRPAVWAGAPSLLLVGQTMDAVTCLSLVLLVFAWRSRRWALAGAAAGLGAAFKVVPAVAVVPLLVGAGWRDRIRVATVAAAVWLACNVPYALRDWERWWFPYRFAAERDDVVATIWAPWHLSVPTVNRLSLLLTILLVGAVCVAVARRRVGAFDAAALAVLGFIVANKVWQPHYVLWLVALLPFTGVATRPLRALELASLAYFAVFWSEPGVAELPALVWAVSIARLGAAAWLAWAIIRAGDVPDRTYVPSGA